MKKFWLSVAVLLLCINLCLASATRRRTLGNCPILPDGSDVTKYVSEPFPILNTLTIPLPGDELRITLKSPFFGLVKSGAIGLGKDNIIPSIAIAKQLNDNLKIGIGGNFALTTTKNNEAKQGSTITGIDKESTSNYSIALGTGYSLNKLQVLDALKLKMRGTSFKEIQEGKDAQNTKEVYQSGIQGIEFNARILKTGCLEYENVKCGVEVQFATSDDGKTTKVSNIQNPPKDKQKDLTSSNLEIAPGCIIQITENTMIVCNPGIGKNTKIETDFYTEADTKETTTTSNLLFPILRMGVESKLFKNLKVRIGINSIYTFKTEKIETKVKGQSDIIKTNKTDGNNVVSTLGFAYTIGNKLTIDVNLNKVLFNNGLYIINGKVSSNKDDKDGYIINGSIVTPFSQDVTIIYAF